MTSRDELTARLRATFLEELDDQLRQLNHALLALEKKPGDAEQVRTLFRAAHTIKGAARVAGVPSIEQACHRLESLFESVRSGSRSLDGSDFALLFAVVDALTDAGARLRAGGEPDAAAIDALVERLPTGDPAASSTYEPAARPAAREQTEPPARPAAVASAPETESAGELVRVRADRLDALLSKVGELVISTGRLTDRLGRHDPDARGLDRVTDELADVVRELRLRPFADVCEALPRAVRDIAAAEDKDVELELEGQDVEADRMVVDALREPLLHLVRNAVDHGIEPPAVRERAGKSRTGHVKVAAELTGGRLVVTVADDGAGIDEEGIRTRLRELGRSVPATPDDIAQALLAGGFSTRREATEISGRGVGVDIARATLERIGGTLDVHWSSGKGTRFVLECPPTPATIRALMVRVGTSLFAIPTAHVQRLRRIEPTDLRRADGRALLPHGNEPLPVHALATLLGPPLEARPLQGRTNVVIAETGVRRAALIVDEVIDEDEIVVRPIAADEGAIPWTIGAALLPSGKVALVLATGAVLGAARDGMAVAPVEGETREAPRRRVLVADDSITTRTLEQSVLEAAGYEVATAVDGEDAWERLEREGADAVVADVEMPRMDGFSLCRRIRASERFAALPVVLVTGLSSDADKARGLDAGADAYIVKSGFDQATLLDTVNQLIGDE